MARQHFWKDQGWIACYQCTTDQQIYCEGCLLCYRCGIKVNCFEADIDKELRKIFRAPIKVVRKDPPWGGGPNAVKEKYISPIFQNLINACRKGNDDYVKENARRILDIDQRDNSGNNLLYHATLCCNLSTVKILFSQGARAIEHTPAFERLALAAQVPAIRIYLRSQASQLREGLPMRQFIPEDSGILSLPLECILAVFDYLPDRDLLRLSELSTTWRAVGEIALFSRVPYKHTKFLSPEELQKRREMMAIANSEKKSSSKFERLFFWRRK